MRSWQGRHAGPHRMRRRRLTGMGASKMMLRVAVAVAPVEELRVRQPRGHSRRSSVQKIVDAAVLLACVARLMMHWRLNKRRRGLLVQTGQSRRHGVVLLAVLVNVQYGLMRMRRWRRSSVVSVRMRMMRVGRLLLLMLHASRTDGRRCAAVVGSVVRMSATHRRRSRHGLLMMLLMGVGVMVRMAGAVRTCAPGRGVDSVRISVHWRSVACVNLS